MTMSNILIKKFRLMKKIYKETRKRGKIISNKLKEGNDIFNTIQKTEIKIHPKKSILLEQYLKRNEPKKEKKHIQRNYTPNDNLSFSNKFDTIISKKSNRCLLREQQEINSKKTKKNGKRVIQPNLSYNMTKILKNENNENYNQKNYKPLRKHFNSIDNINNPKNISFKRIKRLIPLKLQKLQTDHVKNIIYNNNNGKPKYKSRNLNYDNYPINPTQVPFSVIINNIKEHERELYTYS
jgi:hypothetical protein